MKQLFLASSCPGTTYILLMKYEENEEDSFFRTWHEGSQFQISVLMGPKQVAHQSKYHLNDDSVARVLRCFVCGKEVVRWRIDHRPHPQDIQVKLPSDTGEMRLTRLCLCSMARSSCHGLNCWN